MRTPLGMVGAILLAIGVIAFFGLLGKTYRKERTADYSRLGILLALALVFGFVESFLPDLLVPGVKLGLSNVVVLFVIYVYGQKEGLLIAALKALMVSFFAGTFLSMGGWMSITGSMLSAIMMILLHIIAKRFSPIAISLVGALSHFLGQLCIAYLYLGYPVWVYAPLGMVLAMATGILTGSIAALLLRQKNFIAYLRHK